MDLRTAILEMFKVDMVSIIPPPVGCDRKKSRATTDRLGHFVHVHYKANKRLNPNGENYVSANSRKV